MKNEQEIKEALYDLEQAIYYGLSEDNIEKELVCCEFEFLKKAIKVNFKD